MLIDVKKMFPQNKSLIIASQIIIWVVFTLLYAAMDTIQPGVHFGKDFNPPYFATITQLTIGFGDIAPQTTSSRVLVSVHAILSSFGAIVLL